MDDVIDVIKQRRSVRFYDSKPVPKDILEKIIDAGNCAPTGMNAQGWRFVVVTGEEFRKKLAAMALPRYQKWIVSAPQPLKEMRVDIDAKNSDPIYYGAPAVVFVINSGMTADLDTPMVCENMMLAARSLGIGSCWVFFGQFPLDDPEVRAALELKEGEKVYGPILLGYPSEGFPPAPPKKPPVVRWL